MIINAESDKLMYLSTNKTTSNCLALRIVMKDEIDGNILQQAVDITMKRYSYLNVRFIEKTKPCYEENPSPYKVIKARTLTELAGPKTDYHLLAFTYFDNTIRICFFHGLVDGGGIYCIARTLVYYYAKLKYDTELSPEGIVTAETPFNENEIADPYSVLASRNSPKATQKKKKKSKAEKAFNFKDSKLISLGHTSKTYYIKVPGEQMMSFCGQYGMSPATMVSLLLANSIRQLHPDAGLITGGLSMSIRDIAGCMETLRNSVVPTTIKFSQRMAQLSFDMQCTACRGQIILASDEDLKLEKALDMSRKCSSLKSLPYTRATKKLVEILGKMLMSESFQVSYTGQSRMGAAEAYVDSILIDFDGPAPGIFIEMTSVSNSFMLCFNQKWEEDVYVDAFLKELKGHGVHAEIVEEGAANVPAFYSVFR